MDEVVKYPVMSPGNHTFWEVCEHVISLIEKEPKRLKMKQWFIAYNGRYVKDSLLEDADEDIQEEILDLPSCGTAGCLGGNMILATNKQGAIYNMDGHWIMRTLGIYGQLRYDLWSLFHRMEDTSEELVAGLREIMEAHKEQCQSLIIKVPEQPDDDFINDLEKFGATKEELIEKAKEELEEWYSNNG